ncbi:ECF-type Co2+/Ni2+ uptake system [Cyanobacterium sp. HL-69]|uniref:carboxypeptidase regulatory-like domain-containing protein n=1 Tax=Cyanobacterium sp. HL-69 TaxID=2054282 RepID=UPI000CA31514|nr:ECF-type Co2+/Ni2+ uptake system [Cyanobacterium sp. HL-69]
MLKKLLWFSSALIISITTTPLKTFAHGVVVEYEKLKTISVVAQYDTGEPMSNAQIIVHAPNNADKPYLRGVADEDGNFSFTPDENIAGNWTVRVTTAGHGSIINIPMEFDTSTAMSGDNSINSDDNTKSRQNSSQTQGQSSPNTAQRLLMAVSGVWGFVGTALFFSRPKT